MKKYECLCGSQFHTKEDANFHWELFMNEKEPHFITKITWKNRLLKWDFNLILSFISVIILNEMFLMNSSLSLWEKMIEGSCVGILMGSYFSRIHLK